MASAQDNYNRKYGNDDSQMTHNKETTEAQRVKSVFRAHKVALDADPFNPGRLNNAKQEIDLD